MGTTLEETAKAIREALLYALQCNIPKGELQQMMVETQTDLVFNRLDKPKT